MISRPSSGPCSQISKRQQCVACHKQLLSLDMYHQCPECKGSLEYIFDGVHSDSFQPLPGLWKYLDLLPLSNASNIVSLNVGGSEIVELSELSQTLGGARLLIKMDCVRNPTGTFKDREAAVVISRCKELGLDNLVFYSTCNTGRAYTHFSASAGLTSYFFMPIQCQYKLTNSIRRSLNNFIVFVDDDYRTVGPYAKQFALQNKLNLIAPLHERTECYATLAYEQFKQMPGCEFFAQTIASGMGPIGFSRGHENLVKFGLEQSTSVPRLVCIQAEQTNSMYRAFKDGKTSMSPADLAPANTELYEPTLNSTNPVNNYPDLYRCLTENKGLITCAGEMDVRRETSGFIEALERRKISLRFDLEKSLLIGFTGLVRLAAEHQIGRGDRVLLLATGRGEEHSDALLTPNAVIRPSLVDPVDLFRSLEPRN